VSAESDSAPGCALQEMAFGYVLLAVAAAGVGAALESKCAADLVGLTLLGFSFLSIPVLAVLIVLRFVVLVARRRAGWPRDPTLWTLVVGLAVLLLLDVSIGTHLTNWSDNCTVND
jgi:hypothetical protein